MVEPKVFLLFHKFLICLFSQVFLFRLGCGQDLISLRRRPKRKKKMKNDFEKSSKLGSFAWKRLFVFYFCSNCNGNLLFSTASALNILTPELNRKSSEKLIFFCKFMKTKKADFIHFGWVFVLAWREMHFEQKRSILVCPFLSFLVPAKWTIHFCLQPKMTASAATLTTLSGR